MSTMITWGPQLETGIEVIDQQHRQLIDYLGDLGNAISSSSRPQIEQCSRQLIDFLTCHNEYEESLLAAAGYPQLGQHRQQHLEFRIRVHNFTRKLRTEKNPGHSAQQVLQDLTHWLIEHIEHDCECHAPCLRRHLQPQPNLFQRLRQKIQRRPAF